VLSAIKFIHWFLRALFSSRASIAAENMALRQQVAVFKENVKRPKLRTRDRLFWVVLSWLWSGGWKSALAIVKPETVIAWHRKGFKLFWRWKSRRKKKPGRPPIKKPVRELIKQMTQENPGWGAPRIHKEVKLLGYKVSRTTVAKYMERDNTKPPSQTWKTFLKNHMGQTASIDFFTVPTVTFNVLYIFVVLCHLRRRVVHFGITTNPTAEWTAQQIVEAFPFDKAPKYLLRDRDSIYGKYFQRRVKGMGIEEVLTSYKSPWQNPYVERVIGTIRRECLDHMIILNENHLRRILDSYFGYYHESRPHMSLDDNSPEPREVEPESKGKVISIPMVGGLHHRYTRDAA